jgi:low temperature requirement protein LtrA
LTAGLRVMLARDPDEPHRAASSLELLFDLVFVVAVSQPPAHCITCGKSSTSPPAWLHMPWCSSRS